VAGGERPIVMLGADKGVYERSRLDGAHGLAHVLLHAADPEPASPPLERQAQRFGAALLVPADDLWREWPRGRIDWRRLQALRHRWGMSMAALLYRAKELELVSPTAYTNAVKYMSRNGWRVREPGPARPPEEPALLGEAIALLAEHGVRFDQLAAEAQLTAADDLAERLRLTTAPRLRLAL
jgi:Zn-dependent peptidase ImmA (M78 family)